MHINDRRELAELHYIHSPSPSAAKAAVAADGARTPNADAAVVHVNWNARLRNTKIH